MKKVSFFYLVILSVFIFSCNKQEFTDHDFGKSELLSQEEIEKIALAHNKALDEVLNGLEEQNFNFPEHKDNLDNLLNRELNAFYEEQLTTGLEKSAAIEQSERAVSRFLPEGYPVLEKSAPYESPLMAIMDAHAENLSDSQCFYLSQIDEMLSESFQTVDVLIHELNSIQAAAREDLTAKDAQVIMAAAEIGKASLRYWSENIDKWKEVVGEGGTPLKGWFNWKRVAVSDVSGAVGGAVTAAVVNVVPGAGQVSYAGAILGAAAGASTADAVRQVIHNYF